MAHCTEGLTVVARGGAVSWHTALRALLWSCVMAHCTEGLTVEARGGAVSWHTALRASLWWLEVELCHDTLHCGPHCGG